jgi:peptide/nickel transport system substrate-binding protein
MRRPDGEGMFAAAIEEGARGVARHKERWVARRRRPRTVAALSVAALVVVAVACSDDDDNASNVTSAATAGPGTTTPASATSPATTLPSTSSTPSSGTTDETGTTPLTISKGERRPEDPPNPVQGGTLVYGLEADTANPWAPYRTSCATSCLAVLRGISDSLFGADPNGQLAPILAESVEHNADYTQWTIHIRDGITFTDGTPLDGAAVKFNIDTCRASPLTAAAYTPIDHVEATGQDVNVFIRGGPWVALPGYFGYGSCGFMFSPQWLGSLPDVPQRSPQSPVYDAALAATPANGDAQKPVGLGAFKYESYAPGNGNAFKAVRNPDYWRGPNGITGEQLPYLDGIDYVVVVDEDSRSNSVRSGDVDIMMTSMGDTISTFLDDDQFEVNSSTRFGETAYVIINVASGATDPEGKNAASPLLNVDCRRALAGAVDKDRVNQERSAGLSPPANGPFPPGSPGYLDDTGYPKYDVATAQAEMDKCLAALGTDHIEFSFNTTNDPFNVESNSLVVSMWTDAFGDKVKATISTFEQGQYVGLALTGAFQALGARGYSGSDPDQQRLWWQSASAAPIGQLALNAGRITDPTIDAALNIIKSNPDPAARKAAAEDVNRQFGAQAYYLWGSWVLWGIISQPYVHGVQANKLPDGSEGIGLAYAGLHNINQMWCDGGKCE